MVLSEPVFRNYTSKKNKFFETTSIEMQRMLIKDPLHKMEPFVYIISKITFMMLTKSKKGNLQIAALIKGDIVKSLLFSEAVFPFFSLKNYRHFRALTLKL
jgi:hypothetical protein